MELDKTVGAELFSEAAQRMMWDGEKGEYNR